MNKLTPEMRAALQATNGGPVEFLDDKTCQVYFLFEATTPGPVPSHHEEKILEGIAAAERGEISPFDINNIKQLARKRQADRATDV